jgi:iron complex outermembrane recepter protein
MTLRISRVALACATAFSFSTETIAQSNPDRPRGEAPDPIEEVLVTGTHIRGGAPVGVNLITISQDDIRKGGFTRIEEVLRSLPQNFGGGPREDTYVQQAPGGGDRTLGTNVAKSATVNLRGLGAGTTLVLVDGRRLSPSGTTGLFTDVSNIPLAAIERIEILTDGASALYGSDAVGGVVNVIMRKDFTGAETTLRATGGAGGTNDYQFGQTYGAAWSRGRALISYELLERDELPATSRAFSADSDQRRNGGDNLSAVGGNPGTLIIGNRTWAIPANQDGSNLSPASLVEGTLSYRNESEFLWLLPEQQRQGVTASASHDFTDRVTAWMQGVASRRTTHTLLPWAEVLTVPRSNAYYVNPTGGSAPITVRYDLTEDLGEVASDGESRIYNANAGVDLKIGETWKITLDIARSEERASREGFGIDRLALAIALADSNPETALNPFGDGAFTHPATLDTLRGRTFSEAQSDLTAMNILAEGPLLEAVAGDVRLAVGAEYRDYAYESSNGSSNSQGVTQLSAASAGRHLDSFFAELRVPLVGATNRYPGIERLTVSAAVRREQYSDFGNSTVPKLGLSWAPWSALTLRGTWSRSFRAPDLSSLDESRNSFSLQTVPDPFAASGTSTVLRWSGGNAKLRPETADTLTAGLDLNVPRVSGLRLSATYFEIGYENRIGSPFAGLTNNAEFLGNPVYAAYVTREPDQQLRELVCSGVSTSTSQQTCLTTPIGAIVDLRTANTALLDTRGVDAELHLRRDVSWGTVSGGVAATYILRYEQATNDAAALVSLLNRRYSPIDTRLRASFSWSRDAWSAAAFANYVDDYEDTSGTITRKVDSWTTVDVDLAYACPAPDGLLSGLSVSLNAQNLLNSNPPFLNTQFGYDVTNANPYGRIVSVLLRKNW